ncbi:MAG TPA: hypothetical protein VFH61_18630 [Thermoleophilia bacterium]|nr:hypothetical protein [Thermoleophilia bacterium]
MSDINYLPRNWARALARAAVASEAIRNALLTANPDYETLYTHFLGDALPGEWGAAKTNGTSAAVTVAGSKLTMTTGTDDNGYAGQGFGLFWAGDRGFYMESLQALDVLTTVKLEVGVSDAIADAGAVNVKATPSATAADFAVLCFDTDDNTQLDLISQKATGVAADAENVHTLVAATNFRVEMRGQGDVVSVFVNGKGVGGGNIEGGSAISPWLFAQSRAGSASRIFTGEYLVMTGPSGLAIP